jgi:hypothetical protein
MIFKPGVSFRDVVPCCRARLAWEPSGGVEVALIGVGDAPGTVRAGWRGQGISGAYFP